MPAVNPQTDEAHYAELKRRLQQQNLLTKRPVRYYAPRTAALLLGLAIALTVTLTTEHTAIHLLNALFLGLIMAHTAFLGHDLGHNQVFPKARHNRQAGLIVTGLLGISRQWWVGKHNRHHSNPNHQGLDPDLDIPLLAFSNSSQQRRYAFLTPVIRCQAYLFYPLTMLEAIVLKISGIPVVIRNANFTEIALIITHLTLYLGAAFILMPPLTAVLFIIINQAVMGLYLGTAFAPNHKGMPVTEGETTPSYLAMQTGSSRNVRSGKLNDLLYGGLNYQIEHHLFPSMPRNCLQAAQQVIRPYCLTHGIPYYETGVIRSQFEILSHLNNVGKAYRPLPAA